MAGFPLKTLLAIIGLKLVATNHV